MILSNFQIATLFVLLSMAGSAYGQIVRLPSVADSMPNPYATNPADDPANPLNRPRTLLTGYPPELSQPMIPEGQPSAGPNLPGGVLPGGNPFQPSQPFTTPGDYGYPGQQPFPDNGYPGDDSLTQGIPAPPTQPALPKGAKPGVFQQILVSHTYLPPMGSSAFGINDMLVQATFGFPFFTRENPLLVTPAFELQLLEGPTAPSMPAQLYDASVSFMNLRKISDTFTLQIAATPGVHADFEEVTSESIRIPARLLGIWDWRPDTQLIFGVMYLARDDIQFLPAVGAIWTPSEESRWELIFPRPRIAQRFVYAGDLEWWWYVGGEFGGGTYTVADAGGLGPNVITLNDLRLLLGVERRMAGGINGRVELGYVFNRQIEFQELLPTYDASSTLLVRGGLSY
jgi:hypothetical protein